MGKFIKFERMITPIFIQIVFWIGFILIILGGIFSVVMALIGGESGMMKIVSVLTGLAIMVIGPIILRVYCEILIVVFKMQGSLIDIREELRNSNRSVPPAPTPTPPPAQSPPPSRQAPSQPAPSQPAPSQPAPSQQTTETQQSSPPSDADDLLK